MNKPSLGVLIFVATIGVSAGLISIFIAPQGLYSTSISFGAVLLVGAGIVLCLYLYAPGRWHVIAGLSGGLSTSGSSPSATKIGRVSGAGAVIGPAIIAVVSAGTGWSRAAIISYMGAVLAGFALALVALWAILLTRAGRSA